METGALTKVCILCTIVDGPRVAVIGGSLGGLIAGLVLRDAGCDVTIYERSRSRLEGRGAGIVLHPETVRYLEANRLLDLASVSSSARVLRYFTRDGSVLLDQPVHYLFTSYATLYGALLGFMDRERYRLGSELVVLNRNDDRVVMRFADGGAAESELLVGADGIHSTVRRLLFPEVRPRFAGYVGWRGTLDAGALPPPSRELVPYLAYFVGGHSHVLSYPIPSADGARGTSMNWVWYRNVTEGELDRLMTDRAGVRHDLSLPPGAAPDHDVEALRAAAVAELPPQLAALVQASPDPFVQVIVDLEVPWMVAGRACLVGDAAFALRPHIAAGTAKAAADAHALGEAIAGADGDVPAALASWQPRQLALGRATVARARDLGNRVQFHGTYVPGDRSVMFGLREAGDSSFGGTASAGRTG
jgi:2,6-dihydroxypyridine 3-monooxygenase